MWLGRPRQQKLVLLISLKCLKSCVLDPPAIQWENTSAEFTEVSKVMVPVTHKKCINTMKTNRDFFWVNK